MELTPMTGDSRHYIRSVSADGILIAQELYQSSLIISAATLLENWPVSVVSELTEETIKPVLDLRPDLLLLGTGARQVFPDAALLWPFLERGIGVEVMTTAAAGRTFNLVMADGRNAVAALMRIKSE